MISSTSSTMGVQRTTAGQTEAGATGNASTTASRVAASPSQAARRALMPASSETTTARMGRPLSSVFMVSPGYSVIWLLVLPTKPRP